MPEHRDNHLQPQTKLAIASMYAYFSAHRRGAPRLERERLEQEWLDAIRRLRHPVR
ncbi:MAG: hypothetical protein U1F76_32540 [Candidatus Competibacteraceae bacterium]